MVGELVIHCLKCKAFGMPGPIQKHPILKCGNCGNDVREDIVRYLRID